MSAVVRRVVAWAGWIAGVVAGALVLLAVIVGGIWLLTRPPSPESEVRAFMSDRGLDGAVSVDDCRAVQGDSALDLYRCGLRVEREARVEVRAGWVATLATRTYCFRIPRSGSTSDGGAELQSLDC